MTVRNSSVKEDVLYFVFPGSRFTPISTNPIVLPSYITYDTIETMVSERAFHLYNQLRGSIPPGNLFSRILRPLTS